MDNIVIIGAVNKGYHVDQKLEFFDVMNSISIFDLDKQYRDEYLLQFYKKARVWVLDETIKETCKSYSAVVNYLEEYFNHWKNDIDKTRFIEAVAELEENDWNRRFLIGAGKPVILNDGVTLIKMQSHVCNDAAALLLPFLINKLKGINKPSLICSYELMHDCENEENYKISNKFMRYFKQECIQNEIMYIEYSGKYWVK